MKAARKEMRKKWKQQEKRCVKKLFKKTLLYGCVWTYQPWSEGKLLEFLQKHKLCLNNWKLFESVKNKILKKIIILYFVLKNWAESVKHDLNAKQDSKKNIFFRAH